MRWARSGGKPVADQNVLRVDVRFMHRKGWLRSGGRFSLNWSRGADPVGNIGVEIGSGDPPDILWLVYKARDGGSDQWSVMRKTVPIEWQPCNYGGARPWLHCPRCNRRVAVLWGGRRFLCRQCQRVSYASQNVSLLDRATGQSRKLRKRLGHDDGDLSWPADLIARPKGMHRKTYDRIVARIGRHDARWAREAMTRFGCNPLA
jgi:hypothetical protein